MSSDLAYAAHELDGPLVNSPVLLGKECLACRRVLLYKFFGRDHSYRDGYRDICDLCWNTPQLSQSENLAKLKEENYSSHGVRRQRFEHQEEYEEDAPRIGRGMYHDDFLAIVKRLVPDLYFTDGRVVGDIAIFQTSGRPKPEWNDKDFSYIGYCPTGFLPEYSQYEFDTVRDIPIREKARGWRTVLLRLIQARLLSVQLCDTVFGKAEGPACGPWYRQIKSFK